MIRARRELAATAVRLFEERGFNETTVEDIAEAADYSPSTFFRHFGTKEDAVFFDIGERMHTYEALLQDPPPTQETWQHIRDHMLENAAYWEDSDAAFARARTRLFLNEPALYRRYLVYCDEVERILTQVLATQHGTRPEQDVSCEVIAAAAVGAWRAGVAKWLESGGRFEEHVAAGLELIEPIAASSGKAGRRPSR